MEINRMEVCSGENPYSAVVRRTLENPTPFL
jgi:hypothetical protein